MDHLQIPPYYFLHYTPLSEIYGNDMVTWDICELFVDICRCSAISNHSLTSADVLQY